MGGGTGGMYKLQKQLSLLVTKKERKQNKTKQKTLRMLEKKEGSPDLFVK